MALSVDPRLAYPARSEAELFVDRDAPVYRAVAGVLEALGLPRLRGLVEAGDRVFIKPNWVSDQHPQGDGFLFGNVTHGSVLAALADMAFERTGPDGEVIVGEVSTQESNFARLAGLAAMWEVAGLLERRYGRALEIMDLRSQVARLGRDGLVSGLRRAPGLAHDGYPFGDPHGYRVFDLGARSAHAPRDALAGLLRVTDHTYAPELKDWQARETAKHHRPGRHEYCIPTTVLGSDVFINVPKLKTHVKAGVTLALKNLIGINARKALIPHRKAGPTSQGGDEWPDQGEAEGVPPGLAANLADVARARDANWFGNDTLWRTILDLNLILRYGNASEGLLGRPQRRYLALIDGLEGSDGPGPTRGRHRHDGALIAGTNPVAVDTVAATLMGFDWRAFPHIARAYGTEPLSPLVETSPEAIEVRATPDRYARWRELGRAETLQFEAPPGWVTRVELPAGGGGRKDEEERP